MKEHEHVEFVDLFCGGGGSGTGIIEALDALGRPNHGTFVNHDKTAIATHELNHPDYAHYPEDIVKLDPNKYLAEGELDFLWASPECTHFSIAAGNVPKNPQSRAQAESVLDWVAKRRPKFLLLENVKEFQTWGPLVHKKDEAGRKLYLQGKKSLLTRLPRGLGRKPEESQTTHWDRLVEAGITPVLIPNKAQKGIYFRRWVNAITDLGYDIDWKLLTAADYGAATRRTRLFVEAVRRDTGLQICWPDPTHVKCERGEKPPPGMKCWWTAADFVDLSDVGPSIFNRQRPIAPSTMVRLAKGALRYSFKDFIVPKYQGWDKSNIRSLYEPISTITTRHTGERYAHCVLQDMNNGQIFPVVNLDNVQLPEEFPELEEVLKKAEPCEHTRGFLLDNDLIMSSAIQESFKDDSGLAMFQALYKEIKTGKIRAIRPWLYLYFSNGPAGSDIDAPCGTIKGRAHIALCSPVVEFDGKRFLLDIRLRMISSKELALMQGFPEDYLWMGNDTAKMKAIGNSVSRYVSRALTLAVMTQKQDIRKWIDKS